jgi:hypothetical protein
MPPPWDTKGNAGVVAGDFLGTLATETEPLVIKTDGTERMRVTDTGLLTFTNTTVGGSLGFANDTSPMLFMFASGAANPERLVLAQSPGNPNLGLSYRDIDDTMIFTNGLPVMAVALGSGRVGIGTAAPTQALELSSGNVLLPDANAGIDGNLYFGGTTDTGERGMRLFGGTVSPSGAHAGFIDVKTDNNADGLRIRVDTGVANTERMRITARGRVGIGVTNPAFRLDVAGQAHASSFPTSSDAKLKTNVKQLTNVLDKLEKIRAVSFQWNELYESLGRSTGRTEIGVIGQEVEAVFPELVTEWGDERYKAVDYGRLTGILIEAVKELKAQNEALWSRFEALERA